MSDVTEILADIEAGKPRSSEELLPIVYQELRRLAQARMANERAGHTLQTTGLVHEAYIRLVDTKQAQQWNSRSHFFAAAAEAMRRILINHARDRARVKRGGEFRRIDLDKIDFAASSDHQDLLAIDEAIEHLAEENQQCADLVKLRFFTGLTVDEAADSLGISSRTAKRNWAYARAWLADALKPDDSQA